MLPLGSDSLHAFNVFAEHRNFTSAARVLHISQPALHVKIQKLARSLGEDLYERHGRRLVLTAAGQALADFAREQRIEIDRFMSELKDRPSRPLVLACGRGAFLDVIDEGIAAALRDGTNLEFVIDNTPEILAAVDRGEADVAVGVFGLQPDHLTLEPLAAYGQCVVVSQDHFLAGQGSVRLADLDGLSIAVPPSRWPQRVRFDQAMKDAGVVWHVGVEAQGWDLLMRLAQLGVAPALVNACVALRPGLVSVSIEELPAVEYSALMRRDPAKFVLSLIEHLRANVH